MGICLDGKSIALSVFLAFLLGLLASCSANENLTQAPGNAPDKPATVRVAPAMAGRTSVSTTHVASVDARDQVDLVPLGTGLIEQLDVDVGSSVQEGQVIAVLSHGALAAQLHQAQASLLNARAKLASVQEGVDPQQIKAKARLDAARAQLQELEAPSQLEIQSAESTVAKARSELESAQTQLRQLKNPTEAELASAQSLVTEARVALSTAQSEVDRQIQSRASATSGNLQASWQIILNARGSIEANLAALFQPTLSAGLGPAAISTARQQLATDRETIARLLAEIQSSSRVPQNITNALWTEASAQATLDFAVASLNELQQPDLDTVALAQLRVDSAQASLADAEAALGLLEKPTAAALAAAQTEVVLAEQDLVLSGNPFAQHDIDAAEAVVREAQGQVDLVEQHLMETQIVAPFDGFVVHKWLSPGAWASPQTPVITLAGKDVIVSMQVEETDINLLREEQTVTFSTPALPGRQLELSIERIAPGGDRPSHTFLVQMRPVESILELRSGMSGTVSIETEQEVVLVPRKALVYRNDQAALFIVQDGLVHLRYVELAGVAGTDSEILNGIRAGEQVVISGYESLQDGERVMVINN